MTGYAEMIRNLKTPKVMERLIQLYGNRDGMLVSQTARYIRVIKRHEELFSATSDVYLVSAPGRTEIGGNHTDHNNGMVLAAAVNLDTLAAVSKRDDRVINLVSDGYRPIKVDLNELDVKENEFGTTAGILRGIAYKFQEQGYQIGGFDAAVTSLVASGSGLSSSAAFEVMVCAIFDTFYNKNDINYKERAKIAQFAENVYFGKPSGLLDQMASAAGGLVYIDFKDETPLVKPLKFDFAKEGYTLVVVNTGGTHANLTDQYAAIPDEMKQVAAYFGEKVLRDVRPEQVLSNVAMLRGQVSERAIMRSLHFFNENKRVLAEVEALKSRDMPCFLENIIQSGESSFMYLQNVYVEAQTQPLSLALCLAQQLLTGKGAWRIHGGGFAGTTLNFVPNGDVKKFVDKMENIYGRYTCNILDIRPEGAAVLTL